MATSEDAGITQALNGPAFGGPAVERIGWAMTASGPALLVALAGAPIVINVNLDLADDEVAIGGPDSGGNRRLFRGRDNGDGTNAIETVDQPGATGSVGRVTPTPAGNDAIIAADTTRREIQLTNTGTKDIEIYLAATAGGVGTGFTLPVPGAGNFRPLVLRYNGPISTRTIAGAGVAALQFISVED